MYKKLIIIVFLFTFSHPCFAGLWSAVDSLKLEIEKNPDDYKLHFDLGLCYTALEEYEHALKAYTTVLELKPDYTLAKYKIAVVYFAMDSLELARERFEELMGIHADKEIVADWIGNIYHKYGQIHALQCQYEDAINDYHNAIKYRKHSARLNIELSMLYHKIGDTLSANKWFEQAIKILWKTGLQKQIILRYKSIYYYYLKHYDNAIDIERKFIAKNRFDAVPLYNVGVFRIASGDVEGLSDIKNACDTDTTGFFQAVYDAMLAIKSDSLPNAERSLKQRIPTLRRSEIATGLLAWTLEKLGKESEAKKHWFRCYGKLPLGIDVESMRSFIDRFIQTVKKSP